MMDIDTVLAEAYTLAHRDRRAALDHLAAALREPSIREAAEAMASGLRQVVAARSVGAQCGCYVSKLYLDLLDEVLARGA